MVNINTGLFGNFDETHNCSDDEWKDTQAVVGIRVEYVRRDLVNLESCDCAYGKDVVPRREEDGVHESRAAGRGGPRLSEDGKEDCAERRSDRSKLRAPAEGYSDEQRPTGQREAEQQVDHEYKTAIRARKDTEMPDDRDDDPGRKVGKGHANVPGSG